MSRFASVDRAAGGRVRANAPTWLAAALCAVASSLALAIAPGVAGATVARDGGRGYGITPIGGAQEATLAHAYRALRTGADRARSRPFDEPPEGGSELENPERNPVMHSVTTHVIFWDPSGQFTSTTKGIIGGFFGDVAHDSGLASNVFGVTAQYTDTTGNAAYQATFGGALDDTHPYPSSGDCTVPEGDPGPPYTSCLFDEQLQSELLSFIAERGLPTGSTQLYFVLLPHDVATCLEEEIEGEPICSNNFYCAYHSSIRPGTPGEVIYADIPFSLLDSSSAKGCQDDGNAEIQLPNGDRGASNAETRFADVALKYISHEYSEAITDPLVGFRTAWVDEHGQEIGDKCNAVPSGPAEEGQSGFDEHAFTPTLGGDAEAGTLFNQSIDGGRFYLQSEWDNAGEACLMRPIELGEGFFTASSATAGSSVAFVGSAFDPYGALEPTWTFGDGASASGVAPSHTYAAPGQFTVTMTPRDALTGSTGAAVTQTIVVAPAAAAGGVSQVSTTGATVVPPPAADSRFVAARVAIDARTGVVTLTTSVADPGTLGFVATFPNGRFGAFTSGARCPRGRVRLGSRCLPASVVYARGSRTVLAAGSVSVTLKPSASATKALKRALGQRRGVPLTVVLTFRSSRGGAPFSRSQSVTVKPRR